MANSKQDDERKNNNNDSTSDDGGRRTQHKDRKRGERDRECDGIMPATVMIDMPANVSITNQ